MSQGLFGKQRVYLLLFLIVFTMFMIIGCAAPKVKMYPGDQVELSKQTIIRAVPRENKPEKFGISSVDGKRTVDIITFFFGRKWAEEVYVLPGKHKIDGHLSYNNWVANGETWLVAEPGETYILKTSINGYLVNMWLENERTGQKVSGIPGSDDEPKK